MIMLKPVFGRRYQCSLSSCVFVLIQATSCEKAAGFACVSGLFKSARSIKKPPRFEKVCVCSVIITRGLSCFLNLRPDFDGCGTVSELHRLRRLRMCDGS